MDTTFWEYIAVMLLIIGFINEKKIVALENKLFAKIKNWING